MSEGKTMEIPDKKESIEQPANNVYFIQKIIVYRKTDSLEAYCLHIFLLEFFGHVIKVSAGRFLTVKLNF